MNNNLIKYSSFDKLMENINVDGEHYVYVDSNPYKLYIKGISLNTDFIIVGFTGAVMRTRSSPPYYSFRGISEKLGLGLISISDPSLDLVNDLGLSWYVGNDVNGDIARVLAKFLDLVISSTGKRLILCGGSGGGFASLNVQSLMKKSDMTSSFVWNPQTDITKYNNYNLFKYLSSCYGYKARSLVNARQFLKKENIKYKVDEDLNLDSLIMINGYDPNHIRKQIRRFIRLGCDSNTAVYFGDWGNGHVAPPRKLIEKVLTEFVLGKKASEIAGKLRIDIESKEPLIFFINGNRLDKVIDVRATSLVRNKNKIIILKCNIYDFYLGYNIRYMVKKASAILYKSNYLLGIDVAEIAIEIPKDNNFLNRDITVEVLIEDVLGEQRIYSYNLARINSNLKILDL